MTDSEIAALARLRQIDPVVNEFLNGIEHRWGKQGLKRAVHAMIKVAQAVRGATQK
jgi:hypothetical protein